MDKNKFQFDSLGGDEDFDSFDDSFDFDNTTEESSGGYDEELSNIDSPEEGLGEDAFDESFEEGSGEDGDYEMPEEEDTGGFPVEEEYDEGTYEEEYDEQSGYEEGTYEEDVYEEYDEQNGYEEYNGEDYSEDGEYIGDGQETSFDTVGDEFEPGDEGFEESDIADGEFDTTDDTEGYPDNKQGEADGAVGYESGFEDLWGDAESTGGALTADSWDTDGDEEGSWGEEEPAEGDEESNWAGEEAGFGDRDSYEEDTEPEGAEDDFLDDGTADLDGTEVDLAEAGFNGGGEEDFSTVDSTNSAFINDNGQIQVMERSDRENTFEFRYIEIDKIAVSPNRIRKSLGVEGLVMSVQNNGLVEPVVVAPTQTDGIYVLVAGYRRIIACYKAGIRKVPCVVNNKIRTLEIPIIEAIYNHTKPYTMREMIDYIDYLEKEKGIASPSMIEHLLMMDNGDYAKLKDILDDNDPDIVEKLLDGQMTIAQAFKALEQRRKKQSKEEKDLQKAAKVYGDAQESGADNISDSGEQGNESVALTDDEVKNIVDGLGSLDDVDDVDGEELREEGDATEGYAPHRQDPHERERLDPKLRKAVLARDENTCQICKVISGQEYTEVLDVHHIVEVYLGGNDDISNLLTACTCCHKLVHLWGRGELHVRKFEDMEEDEAKKFKRILKLGNVIRQGMAERGMKREELRKVDAAETIGRRLKGSSDQIAG